MHRPRPPFQTFLRLLSPLVLACAIVVALIGAAVPDPRPEGALSERVAQSLWLVEDTLRAAAPEPPASSDDISGALHPGAALTTRPLLSGRRSALTTAPLPDPHPAPSPYSIRAPPYFA
ncbi:hypothetical protein [Pararhodobacter oceanensis]|uniref:hypothetical protein n=1 Tax=Pararhodobacter oceanensis TaxID=2172121 RepID=UPI003A94782D